LSSTPSLQLFGCLGKRQVIGHAPKVTPHFILLHGDRLKKERLASHIHVQQRDLPMPGRNFNLPDMKLSPLIQVPEQPSVKLNLVEQMPFNFDKSILLRIYPYSSRHRVKNYILA
jgi:hypothetical protein